MKALLIIAALASALLVAAPVQAAPKSSSLFVEQHIYTSYIKLAATFYSPQSWATCDEYGYCDYPDVDYTIRYYRTVNGRTRLVKTKSDYMYILDGKGAFTEFVFYGAIDGYGACYTGRPKYYYHWVVSVAGPYGGTYTSTGGHFYTYCGR